jgi:hypothetical protein
LLFECRFTLGLSYRCRTNVNIGQWRTSDGNSASFPTQLLSSGRHSINYRPQVNSHFPPFMSLTLYYFVAFTGGMCFLVILRKKRHAATLPPGPPGDPLVGHLLRMPSTDSALIFHKWCKTYGVFSPSKSRSLNYTFRRGYAPRGSRTNHDNPRFISSCRGSAG